MRDIMDLSIGPRNIGYWTNGFGNQKSVSNYKEIKDFVEEHLGIDNIGISISAFKNGVPLLLFLPFDFDSKTNIRDAWNDAIKLFNYLILCNYGAYLIFSGRKGFHVLIQTVPSLYTRKQIRAVQKTFKNILDLKTLDEQIFGDVRRLMRLPWTYNINGGLCKIIKQIEGAELNLNEIYAEEYNPIQTYSENNKSLEYHDYPCIESIVRSDPEPRHLVRFTYVVLRLSEGFSYEEILDEIESFEWIDFDEDYTRKQIEHIDGKDYVPLSCETLKDLGFCIVEDCPYQKSNKDLIKEIGI